MGPFTDLSATVLPYHGQSCASLVLKQMPAASSALATLGTGGLENAEMTKDVQPCGAQQQQTHELSVGMLIGTFLVLKACLILADFLRFSCFQRTRSIHENSRGCTGWSREWLFCISLRKASCKALIIGSWWALHLSHGVAGVSIRACLSSRCRAWLSCTIM